MGSRELGGGSPQPKQERIITPRESEGRKLVPSMKETGGQGEPSGFDVAKDSGTFSEKRKPEAASGSGGDKPPIDIPPPKEGAEFSESANPKRSKEPGVPELPSIKKVGDAFVIGVDHRAKPGENLPEDYARAVSSADQLLLEGTRDKYGGSSDNYERLAHNTFNREKGKDRIHFLEEGADIESLLVESKMKKDVAAFYRILNVTIEVGPVRGWVDNKAKMEADIPGVLKYLKGSSSVFSEMSEAQLEFQLEKCMKGVSSMTNEVRIAYDSIRTYERQVRDAKVIGPRVTQFMGELSGKKAIFGGKNHMPAIEKAVRGEQVETPPLWPEYMNMLSEEEKQALEDFSAVAEFPKS